ncbi:MAG: DUF4105 domain-containing protein [Fulvivirga sp.]|nr:DUF4105 domain-containing protein [Fulvivirga sp.]
MRQTIIFSKALLLLLFLSRLGYSQPNQLSENAQIRIITVGPYQEELYSAFGHSGIRVYDPANQIDDFYNYGVFDFDQPNFYLNFAKGYLNYRLAVMDYPRVKQYYIYQNRYIHEQVLNLINEEKQELYHFLLWNAQPENMYYYYDYFYDNCATRIRDAMEKTYGDSVVFDGSYVTTNYTIRDLTDLYLQEQPWGDLGIDLCLGLPMDRNATPYMYMFLPDYVELAFDHAFIIRNGKKVPLVAETIVTYESKPQPSAASKITPFYLFSLLAVIVIGFTYLGYRKKRHKKVFDVIWFTIIGLFGWFLFLLWTATDHHAAAQNFNILWAIPLHFPVALFLLKKQIPRWVSYYFMVTSLLGGLTILAWGWLPQDLHNAMIPLVVIIATRGYFIYNQTRSHARAANGN